MPYLYYICVPYTILKNSRISPLHAEETHERPVQGLFRVQSRVSSGVQFSVVWGHMRGQHSSSRRGVESSSVLCSVVWFRQFSVVEIVQCGLETSQPQAQQLMRRLSAVQCRLRLVQSRLGLESSIEQIRFRVFNRADQVQSLISLEQIRFRVFKLSNACASSVQSSPVHLGLVQRLEFSLETNEPRAMHAQALAAGFGLAFRGILCHIIIHTMSHHHTYYYARYLHAAGFGLAFRVWGLD